MNPQVDDGGVEVNVQAQHGRIAGTHASASTLILASRGRLFHVISKRKLQRRARLMVRSIDGIAYSLQSLYQSSRHDCFCLAPVLVCAVWRRFEMKPFCLFRVGGCQASDSLSGSPARCHTPYHDQQRLDYGNHAPRESHRHHRR